MRKKLVAGNWKMNGSIDQNEALLNALVAASPSLNGVDVAVCVPFPYLFQTTLTNPVITLTINLISKGFNCHELFCNTAASQLSCLL